MGIGHRRTTPIAWGLAPEIQTRKFAFKAVRDRSITLLRYSVRSRGPLHPILDPAGSFSSFRSDRPTRD
jgi:hypothetical protein